MPEISQIANIRGKRIGTMYLEYPRIKSQFNDRNSVENYYYYEFNANGTMGSDFVNAWMIFGVGDLIAKGDRKFDVSFDNPSNELLKSAIIFRKVGSTTLVTDADQINRIIQKNHC